MSKSKTPIFSFLEELLHRPRLSMVMRNLGWLIADRVLRLVVGLLVGVWVARYLGPEQYGLFNYALAFVALFTPIATMGLDGLVVRDLLRAPKSTATILGTSFVMQLIGGLLAALFCYLAINFARPEDSLAKLIVLILSISLVSKASEVVKYWFESHVQSRNAIWVENASFLLFAGFKLWLIATGAPLIAFVWATLGESLLAGVGLFYVYVLHGEKIAAWRMNLLRTRQLLQDSWPLILSGLTIMLYMRIDQIMIGHMQGNGEVGIYAAAIRISEMWYFLPMAIMASVFPSIAEARIAGKAAYHQRLQKLYDGMVLLAVIGALAISLSSHWLVLWLFGESYAGAGSILIIHVWSAVFVFLGVASSKWYLLENLQKHAFYRTALGALVNIGANLVLIPEFGALGAAWATLIAQLFASYVSEVFNKKTRISFMLKTAALLPFIPALRRSS